jgi:hypothetical protein
VSAPPSGLASPRLRRLTQREAPPPADDAEHCELCGNPMPAEHRHLLALESRELMCACRACSLLFDRPGAGGGRYRLVPERRLRLDDFMLEDVTWEQLRIPVDMAFFFTDSAAGRVMAFYPGPMGATESQLGLDAWEEVAAVNPVLATLQADVEALLVNRAKGARQHWLVPVDDCYRLVALIRTRWRGFTGGREVWEEIDRFYAGLAAGARPYTQTERS